MAYRERTADDRWTVPQLEVQERDLPKDCHLAFDVFEQLLETRIQERPAYLESPHDEGTEVFFPNYGRLAPSLTSTAGGCGCMSLLIFAATAAAAMAARSLFDDQVMGWTMVIGLGLLMVSQLWWWGRELSERRRIRALPRPPAYGVYLLADAVVDRWRDGCAYFPRRAIVEVLEETFSPSNVTSYTPSIRYVDAKGVEATHELAERTHDKERPTTAQARRWFTETEPDEAELVG